MVLKYKLKTKTNIFALFLAAIVFISSNGVALIEHICNTSNTTNFGFLSDNNCKHNEVQDCCSHKKQPVLKENCCTEKYFYAKLNVEGLIAKAKVLKNIDVDKYFKPFITFNSTNLAIHKIKQYIGLPPPNNTYVFEVKSSIKPTLSKLQIMLC